MHPQTVNSWKIWTNAHVLETILPWLKTCRTPETSTSNASMMGEMHKCTKTQLHQDATAVMDNEFYRSCREVEDMQIYIHARGVKHFMSFLLRHRISLQHLHNFVPDPSGALSKRTSYKELEQWIEHNVGAALEMEDSRNYTGRAKNLSLAEDSKPKKIRIYKLGSILAAIALCLAGKSNTCIYLCWTRQRRSKIASELDAFADCNPLISISNPPSKVWLSLLDHGIIASELDASTDCNALMSISKSLPKVDHLCWTRRRRGQNSMHLQTTNPWYYWFQSPLYWLVWFLMSSRRS